MGGTVINEDLNSDSLGNLALSSFDVDKESLGNAVKDNYSDLGKTFDNYIKNFTTFCS